MPLNTGSTVIPCTFQLVPNQMLTPTSHQTVNSLKNFYTVERTDNEKEDNDQPGDIALAGVVDEKFYCFKIINLRNLRA